MQADFESRVPQQKPARRVAQTGNAAVWQARVIMLVMINVAQLWILAATVDAVRALNDGRGMASPHFLLPAILLNWSR